MSRAPSLDVLKYEIEFYNEKLTNLLLIVKQNFELTIYSFVFIFHPQYDEESVR